MPKKRYRAKALYLFFNKETGIEKEGAKRKKRVRGTVFADEGVIGAEALERFLLRVPKSSAIAELFLFILAISVRIFYFLLYFSKKCVKLIMPNQSNILNQHYFNRDYGAFYCAYSHCGFCKNADSVNVSMNNALY